MLEIIQERELEVSQEYTLNWAYSEGDSNLNGGGLSFPCDTQGNLDWDSLSECALKNLNRALMGELHFVGMQVREWEYLTPRIGKCPCGEEIYLDRFTNTCDGCGADYNSAGQRLAPREQWGWETGEHWTECY